MARRGLAEAAAWQERGMDAATTRQSVSLACTRPWGPSSPQKEGESARPGDWFTRRGDWWHLKSVTSALDLVGKREGHPQPAWSGWWGTAAPTCPARTLTCSPGM